jgi:hypothetical protein
MLATSPADGAGSWLTVTEAVPQVLAALGGVH